MRIDGFVGVPPTKSSLENNEAKVSINDMMQSNVDMVNSWVVSSEGDCSLDGTLERPESRAAPGFAGGRLRRSNESYALFKKKYYIRE